MKHNSDIKKWPFKTFEVDQFPYKNWNPDNIEAERAWSNVREDYLTKQSTPESAFNFRLNLIDNLKPFVNKRGIRQRPFIGEEHEVKLVQIDNIPGRGKLMYRDLDREVGTLVPVEITSREYIKKDLERVSKRLYKKAKKL